MSQRVSLQSLITLSVLSVGILSGTVGLAYAYWHAKQSLQTTVGITFQEIARQSADKAALMLVNEIEWLQRLSALPSMRASVEGEMQVGPVAQEFERWREEQNRYFHSLAIVRADGQLVGSRTSEHTRIFYAQQPWWSAVFRDHRPWAGPFTVDEEGRGYWEVAVPIGEQGGPVRGALKVIVGTDRILSSILGSRIGRTGHMMVLADDGSVLVCSLLPPTLHTALPAILAQWGTDTPAARWFRIEQDAHGERGGIVGVARVVLPAEVAQARVRYILMQQDPAETFEPLLALVEKLAAFWVGAIGFIAWLRWRLARRIVRPIGRLIERVDRLGAAKLSESLPAQPPCPPSGIVEIDALAASFDDLSQRLEQASRAKAQYVGRLEQANLDLATSEEHYRLLWNHSVDTKILVDPTGAIQDINRRGEVMLGRPAATMANRSVTDLVADFERPRLLSQLALVLQSGATLPAGTIQVPTPGGELTMELDFVPVRKSGRIESIVMQLSDLTERKELERQLLRSERLASLSQFASMFAHDIRNPLAGIKKTLEWLGRRPEMEQDPPRRCLEDLRFTTDLLLGMINDMLDVYQENYSGLPLSTSPVSPALLLKDVMQLFRSEAEAQDVRFLLRVPDDEVRIMGDGRRLQRVLINLVHNALKYSPPQGTIMVTLQVDETQASQGEGAAASPHGPTVTVQIEDEGPGITPEDLPHLFEMFFRKKDGQDYRIGRGLGLHFCRLVVEAHGGNIRAGNRPEGGALFTVALPVRQEQLCPLPS
ncbi:MAG: ATP-binding region, ATPase-like:Histidine kinase A, N-terminal [Nitrospira sp.]|jgi:PAS domain S-box-containing protein|nr:MAG: ATP-binding region, ATPase-like:Histidine kinase A, N-terminal [Nitrospira sp.]